MIDYIIELYLHHRSPQSSGRKLVNKLCLVRERLLFTMPLPDRASSIFSWTVLVSQIYCFQNNLEQVRTY